MKTALRLFSLIGLISVFSGIVGAQIGPSPGTPPFETFARGPIDNVDLSSLNVSLSIPVLNKPGRGLPVSLVMDSDSSIWSHGQASGWIPTILGFPFNDTNLYFQPLGYLQESGALMQICYSGQGKYLGAWVIYTYSYYDPSGTAHLFPLGVSISTGGCGQGGSGGSAGRAIDGSGYSLTVSNYGNNAVVLDKHGRQIAATPISVPPTYVETDTNGNQVGQNASGTVTDTLGATALTMTTTGTVPTPATLTYTAPNGQPATYKINYSTVTLKSHFGCPDGLADYGPTQIALISEIDLPDQSTIPADKYTFTYEPTPGFTGDTTGRLASVTLPMGGTISYSYSGSNNGINCADGSIPTLTRTTPDGSWTYVHSIASTPTTTVTDPLGNQTVLNFQNLENPGGGVSPDGIELQRFVYQGSSTSGTLLESIYTCYNGATLPCATSGTYTFPTVGQKTVYTKWGNNQESETNTTYDTPVMEGAGFYSNNSLEIERDEYDYGNGAPGPLLRKTTTSYAALANGILDRPSQVSVFDSSGNLKAQTTYTYDGATPVPSGITTQHVSITGSRGNATTIARLVSGTSTVSENLTYFDTGTVNIHYDGNNNKTTYAYSGTYTGAYPTTITSALNQTTTNTYDIHSGLRLSTIDPNNLTTSFTYDSLLRPLTDSYPDGGQTTYSYPSTNEVDISQKLDNSGHNRTASRRVDGLGRRIQQIVSNGEAIAYDQTDTCYDADGRTGFTSYPYQGTGLSSSPCPSAQPGDSFSHDPLNRTTKVTHSDGSAISISYSGNSTTATDEQGITRQGQMDGTGRLTQVIENPSGLNYATAYTYDALGNLTGVSQAGSRQRTFVYDSLSRLTSSTTPEANWSATSQTYVSTTYLYDADGNLINKTEPARNQQGTSMVTLTYCYDALNRMTAKGYTSQTCTTGWLPTPVATYVYDGGALPSGCSVGSFSYGSAVGKRTAMCDPAGSEAWSYNIVSGSGWQTTDRRTTNSLTKSTIYQDDFLGLPTSIEYPSGRTISYSYNGGARPASVLDGTTSVYYANTAHYWAGGSLCWAVYGAAITGAATYNGRLQPLEIQSTGGVISYPGSCTGLGQTGNLLDLTYGFHYGSGDNGNVMAIENNRDGTRTQDFAYDALNRLLAANASTYATSPSHCWGEAYQYDNQTTGGAWGNLTNINSISTAYTGCTQESLGVTATAQNQITSGTSIGYDTAGNMITNSGSAYTYDAEDHLTSTAGVNYTYDGDGKRVEKSNGKIYWYGMDGSVLDETDLAGSTTNSSFNEYVFVRGQRIARRDSSNDTYYYSSDHLGSSRVISEVPAGGGTATLCYDADFYPFGGERAYTTSCSQNYKFSGKERDIESNLDNFGARYDSSNLGRFMSPDPLFVSASILEPQTWNRYSYALNNPMAILDPTGLWDWGPSAGGTATDDELKKRKNDKSLSRKDRNAAKNALNFRQSFRAALAQASGAAHSGTLSSTQQAAVQGAVSAYGTENDDNGVTVSSHQGGDPGVTTPVGGNSVDVSFRSDEHGVDFATDVVHEGSHVEDQLLVQLDGATITHGESERNAYMAESYAAQALNLRISPRGAGDVPQYEIWNKGWKAADVQTLRSKGIDNILNDKYSGLDQNLAVSQ
jgi:RHS repeat-associated protein